MSIGISDTCENRGETTDLLSKRRLEMISKKGERREKIVKILSKIKGKNEGKSN